MDRRFLAIFITLFMAGGMAFAQGFPFDFQDRESRVVELSEAPRRIVSLNPGNTEILVAIGAVARIAGIDRFSASNSSVHDLPQVGAPVTPSYEAILALRPDLVLITNFSSGHRSRFEALGLKVAMIDPVDLDGIYASILLFGRIVERQAEADGLVREMKRRVGEVQRRVSHIPDPEKPSVFVEIWPDPLRTAGPGTFIHEMIVLAGGRNIAADAAVDWPAFSLETVIQRNPDAIVTPVAHGFEEMRAGTRAQWRGVKAIREKRVLLVEQDLIARPGPGVVDALELIAAFLHPSLFEDASSDR